MPAPRGGRITKGAYTPPSSKSSSSKKKDRHDRKGGRK